MMQVIKDWMPKDVLDLKASVIYFNYPGMRTRVYGLAIKVRSAITKMYIILGRYRSLVLGRILSLEFFLAKVYFVYAISRFQTVLK